MPDPLVSVLMPLYNMAAFAHEAIESVRSETYGNFELLICNDGSTDGSPAIAERHAREDPRIRLFHRDTNSGNLAVVSRFLADQARGEFFIVSDSDDVALPARLRTLVDRAQRRPDASVVYGIVHAVSPDLKTVRHVFAEPFCPYRLFVQNFVPDGGSLIRRSAYDAAGGFDPAQIWAEDYHLRLRLALAGPMVHVGELVYLYRWHRRSWTARHSSDEREVRFKRDILERDSAALARVRRGEITSYRDAVVAAYWLAHRRTSLPRPPRRTFSRWIDLLFQRAAIDRSRRLRLAVRRATQQVRAAPGRLRARVGLGPPPLPASAITAALQSAGLAAGDTAMVHCSLSALGWVRGGAATVIDCLQAAVGAEGRLLMPTFTYGCDLGVNRPSSPPAPAQCFHEGTPSSPEMGLVAETFRQRPGVHRIIHPGLSLAVWGADAAGFARAHRMFDSFALNSPMHPIYEQGKVVMIGTDLTTVTALHLAEYLAAVPYAGYRHFFGMEGADDNIVHLRTTGASGAFAKLDGLLELDCLAAKSAPLGASRVVVLPACPLIDYAAQLLRHLPDFLLGTESASCRDRRAFCRD
ncbi:MAG TPA: AAC(3) family N-acetyltransferase [Opitutus sp.]|nr:AAC(3) family N-acetyltransferase [Opitutus sp.]